MSAWHNIKHWLKHEGFPLGVLLIGAVAIAVGLTSPAPEDLPEFVIGSVAVWRVWVMAFCFAPLYIIWQTFVMALEGRGFTRFGPRGAKAGRVVRKQQSAARKEAERVDGLEAGLKESNMVVHLAFKQLSLERAAQRREIEDLRQRVEDVQRNAS